MRTGCTRLKTGETREYGRGGGTKVLKAERGIARYRDSATGRTGREKDRAVPRSVAPTLREAELTDTEGMTLMKKTWMLGVVSGCLAAACSGTDHIGTKNASVSAADRSLAQAQVDDEDDGDDDGDDEQDVALADVPGAVKDAAIAAVPGLVLTGAEKETERGVVVYSLEGKVGSESYEVEVGADGKVREIESGEDGEKD